MLRTNLWVEQGLVNGALGTVVDIVYSTSTHPLSHLPACIFIHFDNYSGPVYPGTQAVPIVPITKSWTTNGNRCSRRCFPLILAWSMTVHKCQGLELDTVKINIGSKEMSPGLTFVAVSRVRRLQNVLFRPHFPFHRLSSIGRMNGIKQRVAEMARFHSIAIIDHASETC